MTLGFEKFAFEGTREGIKISPTSIQKTSFEKKIVGNTNLRDNN